MSAENKWGKHNIIEWVVVGFAITLSIAILAIPTVVFYVFQDNGGLIWGDILSGIVSQLQLCTNQTMSTSLDNITRGTPSVNRTCVAYEESAACYSSLQEVLKAQGHSTLNMTVNMQGNSLAVLEKSIQAIVSSPLLSESCKSHGFPLYCHYLLPPCVGGTTVTLTKEECVALKTIHCADEVKLLNRVRHTGLYQKFSYLDPNCSALSEEVKKPADALHESAYNSTASEEDISNTSLIRIDATCHPDFTPVCSLCLPSCTTLYYDTRIGYGLQIDDVLKITCSSLEVLGAIIFFILAAMKWREVFTFPTVLVFYENVVELIVGILVLLPFVIGRQKLLCSYPDIVRTLNAPPTPFCTISGFLFQVGVVLPILLWTVHLAYITILVSCPIFGEQKLKKWSKRIHIIAVPLVTLISVIAPIAIASTVGYATLGFPPTVCFAYSIDATFYSIAIPDSVVLCAGVIMMILIVRKIHENFHSEANKLKRKLSRTKCFFSAQERKIMMLSAIFILLGTVVLVLLTYTAAQRTDYAQGIVQYSKCQLYGNNPDCTGLSEDMRIAINIFNTFAILFMALTTYANIFFILTLDDLKKFAKIWQNFYLKVKGGAHMQNSRS